MEDKQQKLKEIKDRFLAKISAIRSKRNAIIKESLESQDASAMEAARKKLENL